MLYVNPQISSPIEAGGLSQKGAGREAEVLQEYEQLFIYQMVKEMRKTVPDYGVVDNSQRAHFDEMMDDFLAGEMAKSGQFGIARQLAEQIAARDQPILPTDAITAGISVKSTAPGVPLAEVAPEGLRLPAPKRGIELYKGISLKNNAIAAPGE